MDRLTDDEYRLKVKDEFEKVKEIRSITSAKFIVYCQMYAVFIMVGAIGAFFLKIKYLGFYCGTEIGTNLMIVLKVFYYMLKSND